MIEIIKTPFLKFDDKIEEEIFKKKFLINVIFAEIKEENSDFSQNKFCSRKYLGS